MALNNYKSKYKKALWVGNRLTAHKVYSVNGKGEVVERRREYIRAKKRFLKEHSVCVMCEIRKSTDIHHVRGRLRELLTATKFWKAVCRPCHTYIHANIEWARRHGLIALAGDWNKQP